MNSRRVFAFSIFIMLVLLITANLVSAETVNIISLESGFTYQGQLKSSDEPYTGTCDFQFLLFEAQVAGSQVGDMLTQEAVALNEGFFTVTLDFGPGAFNGDKRWLEIWVRCPAGVGDYQQLSPRQALTATPYAWYAQNAPWSGISNIPPGFADGVDDDTLYTAGTGLTLSGTTFHVDTGYLQRRVSGTCDPGNAIRVIAFDGSVTCEPVGGSAGWSLTGNAGTNPQTNFLGTSDNVALELRVNGKRALRLEPNGNSSSLLGGSAYNQVFDDVVGAVIGGGGNSTYENRVTDNYGTVGGGLSNQAGDAEGSVTDKYGATVGGGYGNTASGYVSTVGGGQANEASGVRSSLTGGYQNTASGSNSTVGGGQANEASGFLSTVGGGYSNTASDNYSTVGGGFQNTASYDTSTVGGGSHNTASGSYSTVPGGYYNLAQGYGSLAAGYSAKANNIGCFVWGDVYEEDVTCDVDNRWVARARGGVYFYTNAGLTTGAYLAAGEGSWSSISDRNMKANIEAVETTTVLEALMEVPISTWNYTTQDDSIRHIGPMAQDFYAAFGVGGNDTAITTIDADGVALAAIQGLYAENLALKAQVDDLETRLTALEAVVSAGQSPETSPRTSIPWIIALGLFVVGGVWMVKRREEGV